MDVSANKAVVFELYRRHNAGDFDVFDELMSDDFVEHERLPGLEPTRAGVRHLFEMIHAAFEKATLRCTTSSRRGTRCLSWPV